MGEEPQVEVGDQQWRPSTSIGEKTIEGIRPCRSREARDWKLTLTDRCARGGQTSCNKIEGWKDQTSSLMSVVSGGDYVPCT